MKRLLLLISLLALATAPLAAKVTVGNALTDTHNDAMLGETIIRSIDVGDSISDSTLQLQVIQLPNGSVRYRIYLFTRQSLNAIPNGMILNIDGERTILRTTEGTVRYNDLRKKLQYTLPFMVDKATFEKIAGATKLLEFTPMIDEQYFIPTSVKGKDLTNYTAQVRRVLSDEPLPTIRELVQKNRKNKKK